MAPEQGHSDPRLERARYLLAMGITPWVTRGATATQAEVAEQSAGTEPQAQPEQRDYQLAVRVQQPGQASFSWTEPTGKLLRALLAAVAIDPRRVLFVEDSEKGVDAVPLWQFGGTDPVDHCVVLPSLQDMLESPALKGRAWQILTRQASR